MYPGFRQDQGVGDISNGIIGNAYGFGIDFKTETNGNESGWTGNRYHMRPGFCKQCRQWRNLKVLNSV